MAAARSLNTLASTHKKACRSRACGARNNNNAQTVFSRRPVRVTSSSPPSALFPCFFSSAQNGSTLARNEVFCVSQTRKLNQRRAAVPTSTTSRSRSRSNTAPPQAAAAGAAATQTAAPSSSLIEQIAKAAWDLFWTLISYMLQPTIIIYVFVTVKLLDKYEKVIKPVYPNQKFNVCFCWPARMLKITEEEFRQNLWNWVKI